MLRDVFSVPTLMRIFMNGCWILSDAFSASIKMIRWFFYPFVNVVYHMDWFQNLNHPYNPGIILFDHGIWSFLYVGFGLLIFSEEFCIYIHQRYWPIIFFFCSVFFWFWYWGNGGLIEWIWECSILFNFLHNLRRIGISSSLHVC